MAFRFTSRLIGKLLIVVVIIMFCLPLVYIHLESESENPSPQMMFRTPKPLFLNSIMQEIENEPDLGPKEFGPVAELKSIIGNFEPVLVPETGPGEGGFAIHLSGDEVAKGQHSVQEYGFNMVVSDKISMTRNIPDTRMDECKYWHYPEDLPTASVIIVFHNEGFSTLMRTVHSVIKMSPKHLLHEVVLVDDYSDKTNLKEELEEYIKERFEPGLVNLHRNKERLGLINTRSNGARFATGDVIIFLDAHCECGPNWLVPLLARIRHDRTIMAVPTIDGIDWNTFQYSPVYQRSQLFRGIFEWGFLYKESEVPTKFLNMRKHNSEPYKAPTHAGGLFAMDRKYFFELGAYDPGLQIWGGENFELSFKLWQCGGSIEWVPCSRVGHVYRNHMPYSFGKINPRIPIILINYMRVVEVWLDPEYREYFYTREPTIRGYPIGDLSDQLEFKRKHQCRSFKWYMENVATEVLEKFPVPPPNLVWGEIILKDSSLCWDTKGQNAGGGPIGVGHCHHMGGSQLFRFNTKGQIGYGERCIDKYDSHSLSIHYCHVQPIGPWKYNNASGLISLGDTKKCVKAISSSGDLKFESCDPNDQNQRWDIRQVKTW